jgi:hypothetical protein
MRNKKPVAAETILSSMIEEVEVLLKKESYEGILANNPKFDCKITIFY